MIAREKITEIPKAASTKFRNRSVCMEFHMRRWRGYRVAIAAHKCQMTVREKSAVIPKGSVNREISPVKDPRWRKKSARTRQEDPFWAGGSSKCVYCSSWDKDNKASQSKDTKNHQDTARPWWKQAHSSHPPCRWCDDSWHSQSAVRGYRWPLRILEWVGAAIQVSGHLEPRLWCLFRRIISQRLF